jgi:hypothetical protein
MISLGNLYGTCFILGSQSANPRLKGGQAGTDRAVGAHLVSTSHGWKYTTHTNLYVVISILCVYNLISRNTYKSWLKSNNEPGVGVFGEDVPENIEPGLL